MRNELKETLCMFGYEVRTALIFTGDAGEGEGCIES